MNESWKSKFTERLHARQQARKEQRRDFSAYQDMVSKLFEQIAHKVAGVDQMTLHRPMHARTDAFRDHVSGHIDTIKSLALRCDGKTLEFVPDGINFDFGRGRMRIVHRCKLLPDYIYLYLVIDPESPEEYPGNLRWVIHDREGQRMEELAPFDEVRLEALIESVFLQE